MKKTLTFACLVTLASVTQAQTVSTQFSKDIGSETSVQLSKVSTFGTVDVTMLNERHDRSGTTTFDRATGYSLGYQNGFSVGQVNLTGKVDYGRLTGAKQPLENSFLQGNTRFVSIGAEAQLPLSDTTALFANYRHRNFRGDFTPVQNRAQAGAVIRLNDSLSGRIGVSHARSNSNKGTGVVVQAAYVF